jgi:hypothetical protein
MATVRNSETQKNTRKTGRGNENVSEDDVRRAAHTETTNKWERVPGAIEYLRQYIEYLSSKVRDRKDMDMVQAIQLMDMVYKLKERVAEHVKTPVEGVYDMLRLGVVPELMLEKEITTITVDGIGRCTVQDDISATVPKDNKEEFIEWLVEHELENIITQTVNAQTLAAFVREQIRKGKDGVKLPAKLIKITPVTRAVITRSI